MASIITHSLVGLGAALLMPKDWRTGIFLTVATVAPSLPDLDVLGFYAGVPYDSFWGHRGFVHSFCFAFCLAALLAILVRYHQKTTYIKLWIFLGIVISTHGILDAMTTGGHGIALFSPFNNARIFLPCRVIQVSPMR
ncbi:MAG: metal-dependent hydrolase, partial [Bacteroidales bacterium]